MMTANEYRETLIGVMKMKLAEVEKNPLYQQNKWVEEEYANGLNEGFLEGFKEAIRTLEKSAFLVGE